MWKDQLLSLWGYPCIFFVAFPLLLLTCALCVWVTISFPILRKFFIIISSNIFSCLFLLFSSGTPMFWMLGFLTLSQRSLRLSSFLFILFSALLHLFSCSSAGKESACNVGDLGSILQLGRSLGEGKVYPLQYCGLENSMDYIVHEVATESDMTKWLSLSFFIYSNYSLFYSLILSSASAILLLISPQSGFNLNYCIVHYWLTILYFF